MRFHDILLCKFFFRLHLDVDGVTHGSGVELKDGREDIDILAEILFDSEEITVSAGGTLREESNAEKSPAEQFGPKFAFFYYAFFGNFGSFAFFYSAFFGNFVSFAIFYSAFSKL